MSEYTPTECKRLHDEEGLTWAEIGAMFDLGEDAPRKLVARWEERWAPELETIEGVGPEDEWPDAQEVLEKQKRAFELRKQKQVRKQAQRVGFSKGPVGIAFLADQHLGSSGSDAGLAMEHAQLVCDTPGLYAVLVGDLVDSFILQKYFQLRHNAPLGVIEEWALVKLYLETVAPKLIGVLDGNHDAWPDLVTGLPVLADFLAQKKRQVLYDKHEILARVRVGPHEEWVIKARHQWAGSSQYNPFHGIMKATMFDRPFHVGIGAHDHRGAMVATFRVAFDEVLVETAAAVKCGTYKRFDRYQRERGFPLTGPKVAPVVIFQTEPRNLMAFDEIEVAADYLNTLYGPEE